MARAPARRPNRGNLIVSDSEDEDEDDAANSRRSGRGAAAATPAPPARPGPVQSIVLSDDEDDLFDAAPQPRVLFPPAGSAVGELLRSRGVAPRDRWLETCLDGLALSHPGFAGLPAHAQAELCFAQFLAADLNVAGAGCLPPSLHALHGAELSGPFLVQVDEVTDVGHSLRDRYQEKPAGLGRTLKLSMTDGVQRVFGIEYRPIRALQVLSPAGMKVSLRNVCVRRGLLLLVPEVVEILGGCVEAMEAARLRAVQVINKPPRGRWTREGTAEPSLVERATAAAWPASSPGSDSVPMDSDGLPDQRPPPAASAGGPSERPAQYADGQQAAGHRDLGQYQRAQPTVASVHVTQVEHTARMASVQRHDTRQPAPQNQFSDVDRQARGDSGIHSSGLDAVYQALHADSAQQEAGSNRESISDSGPHFATIRHVQQTEELSTVQPGTNTGTSRESVSLPPSSAHVPSGQLHPSPAFGRLSLQPRRLVQSKLAVDRKRRTPEAGVQVIDLDATQESDQHSVGRSCTPPSGHAIFRDEMPFMYLADLKERATFRKDNDVVRGRVKCCISGVINFRFKDTDEFILYIYIEDGSFITPANVQHQLLQRLIGFSPKEVMAGLNCPDKSGEMTDNMRRFQKLLENFEGFMDVEVANAFATVTISQMTKGLQSADVEALYDRVCRQSEPRQTPPDIPTIDLTTP